MKKLLLVVLILFMVLIGCDSDNPNETTQSKKERVEEKRQTTQQVRELCSKYNAVANWDKDFDDDKFSFYTFYTLDVQEALIRADGRPILFFAGVEDVIKRANKYSVRFFAHYPPTSRSLDLILDCTSNQVDKIVSHTPSSSLFRLDDYAVIAQISEVEKLKFALRAYAQGYDYAEVDVEAPNRFIATGSCLDLIFVGNYSSQDFSQKEEKPEEKIEIPEEKTTSRPKTREEKKMTEEEILRKYFPEIK